MPIIKYFKFNRDFMKGQSLVEVLLIVVLITTVIAGSVGFLIESYSLTQFISDQTTATYLGIEGIEIVKNMIDGNYMNNSAFNTNISDGSYEVDYLSADLKSYGGHYLWFDPHFNVYQYNSSDLSADAKESVYTREIDIKNFDSGIRIESIVRWQGRRCPSSGCNIDLVAYFYDWR